MLFHITFSHPTNLFYLSHMQFKKVLNSVVKCVSVALGNRHTEMVNVPKFLNLRIKLI